MKADYWLRFGYAPSYPKWPRVARKEFLPVAAKRRLLSNVGRRRVAPGENASCSSTAWGERH